MEQQPEPKTQGQGRKPYTPLDWLGLSVLGLLLCAPVLRLYDLFVYLPHQKAFIAALQTEFPRQLGFVLFRDIAPDDNWDEVCVMRASYGFPLLAGREDYAPYFGTSYNFLWRLSRVPSSIGYGIGFSFLKEKRAVRFVKIPPVHLEMFSGDGVVRMAPVTLSSTLAPSNSEREKIYFADLNVDYAVKDQPCYPRETAFIKFVEPQRIQIGG